MSSLCKPCFRIVQKKKNYPSQILTVILDVSYGGFDGGSDGVDGGFDGVDGGFDGFDGSDGLDGLGDCSKMEKMSNEMLRFSPLKTWLCFPGKLMDPEARDGLTLSK